MNLERLPTNIAHRGASFEAPENTIEALELAVEQGAGGLELDLHRSSDGEIIVLHDETVDRTTDGSGLAEDMSLEQIRALDAGYFHSDGRTGKSWRDRGVRIPTLVEVLRRFPDQWLSLDLKAGDEATETRTIELLREHQRGADVALGAETDTAAERIRALAPEFPAFFSRRQVRRFVFRSLSRCWLGYRAPSQSLQIPRQARGFQLDRRRLVNDAHARGIRVLYWTINDRKSMNELLDLGADAIITDQPALLSEVLRERADS